MKYKIESSENEIDIEVTGVRGKQQHLLAAFNECQEGRCTCPTREYAKLDTLEIENDEDTIRLRLMPKTGQKFDQTEISKCLEYTKARIRDET